MAYCKNCEEPLNPGTTLCPYCLSPIRQLSKDIVIKYTKVIDEVISEDLPFKMRNFDASFFRLDPKEMVSSLSQGLKLPECNFKVVEIPLHDNHAARFMFDDRNKTEPIEKLDITTLTMFNKDQEVPKISASIQVDPQLKKNQELVAAGLAHEVAHFYLTINGLEEKISKKGDIYVSISRVREYITDLTTIRLGYSELMIKAYKVVKKSEKVGIILTEDLVYARKFGYLTVEELSESEAFLKTKYNLDSDCHNI